MDNENIRAVVDYALEDNPTEMKDALYDAINDKIFAAIEQRKVAIASNLLRPNEQQEAEIETAE